MRKQRTVRIQSTCRCFTAFQRDIQLVAFRRHVRMRESELMKSKRFLAVDIRIQCVSRETRARYDSWYCMRKPG